MWLHFLFGTVCQAALSEYFFYFYCVPGGCVPIFFYLALFARRLCDCIFLFGTVCEEAVSVCFFIFHCVRGCSDPINFFYFYCVPGGCLTIFFYWALFARGLDLSLYFSI